MLRDLEKPRSLYVAVISVYRFFSTTYAPYGRVKWISARKEFAQTFFFPLQISLEFCPSLRTHKQFVDTMRPFSLNRYHIRQSRLAKLARESRAQVKLYEQFFSIFSTCRGYNLQAEEIFRSVHFWKRVGVALEYFAINRILDKSKTFALWGENSMRTKTLKELLKINFSISFEQVLAWCTAFRAEKYGKFDLNTAW